MWQSTHQQWLFSDPHFDHKHILEYCPKRPWDTVEGMNEGLCKNINAVVRPLDTVWILGDFAFKKNLLLKAINGRKILVRGNHDSSTMVNWLLKESVIDACINSATTKFRNRDVFLTHIPTPDWPGREQGTIMFHGHRHGGLSDRGAGWVNTTPNCYDVGVDVHTHLFSPISIDSALRYVDQKNTQLNTQLELF